LGLVAFAGAMTLVFFAIFAWAKPVMEFVGDDVFGGLGTAVRSSGVLGHGALESLVVDGGIAGVGAVLTFLPQILILAAFLSALQRALVFAGAYFLGIVVAIPVAWILKRTLLRGETQPFLMELPPYKRPGVRSVAHKTWRQGFEFVRRAGTLILATSVVVWA